MVVYLFQVELCEAAPSRHLRSRAG